MLIRRYRAPAPRLLPLWVAAAMADAVGISGRVVAAVVLRAAPALVVGTRPGGVLPEPVGGGQTRRLRLVPPDVIEADGIRYENVNARWPELCAALVAAGCRGSDRLPRHPAWLDWIPDGEIPLELVPSPAWWGGAVAERAPSEAPPALPPTEPAVEPANADQQAAAGEPWKPSPKLQKEYDARINADYAPRLGEDYVWGAARGLSNGQLLTLRKANPDPRLHKRGPRRR